jgi:formylglycine-generating enzyme required for sulfatase activity
MPEPTRIAERYEIIDEVGRGGFAVVYKARDTRTERDVALKVITGTSTEEASFVERFRQEARTAAGLRHPNTVPVYDFGEADGTLYLAMALIGEGRTLRDLLAEQAPLGLEHVLRILMPLAGALDYLHQHDPPLTHRDVKPSNVLLGGDAASPWVVLTDFGLVRSLQASTVLTMSGSILGTPAYMAPEQADAKQWGEVTPLADVYALGVVAYEMLTGRAPFEGGTATVLHAHAYEPPPPPIELLPDLGEDLSDALLRALRKPPAERYPSAGAFVDALQAVAETWTEAALREATLEQLEAQARELLEAGEWLEALDRCTQMVRLDPDRPAALEMLTAAKQGLDRERAAAVGRRRLEERYAQGLKLLEEEKWKRAIAAFEEVAEGNPDFRDVQEKVALAQDELQRAQWYDEAIAHAEAERWPEASRTWLRVLRARVDYRGGDAAERLLGAAEGLLRRNGELTGSLERSRGALALYEDLAAAVERGDWQEAIEVGEELSQSVPDLQGVQAWVDRAREQLRGVGRRSEQEPKGNTMVWEGDGKEMVRIPAGEFLYGDDKEKRELPEFWIDKTPVTNAEYARFVSDMEVTNAEYVHVAGIDLDCKPPEHWKGNTPPGEIADHPVTFVSWHDALAYAAWAGKRLPTEEEWEKAARGTDGRTYPWGDEEPTLKRCNFWDDIAGSTSPVGKYSPQGDSPYGCVDMAGNVWEWTASGYERPGIKVVTRGGGWGSDPTGVRAASRDGEFAQAGCIDGGFRCARGY